jgi:hypothetical protein
MAESTLSLRYADLKKSIGYYLGYGREESAWTAAQLAHVDELVQAAYRQFLYPPILPDEAESHHWSFLEPTTSMEVRAEVTGTLYVAPSRQGIYHIIETDDSVFTSSMVGDTLKFDTSGAEYVIRGYIAENRVKAEGIGNFALFGIDLGTVSDVFAHIETTDVTISASSFVDAMVGDTLVDTTSTNEYEVEQVHSATWITVIGDATGEADAFTIEKTGVVRVGFYDSGDNQTVLYADQGFFRADMVTDSDTVSFTGGSDYAIAARTNSREAYITGDATSESSIDANDEATVTVNKSLTSPTYASQSGNSILTAAEDDTFRDDMLNLYVHFDKTRNIYQILDVLAGVNGTKVKMAGDATSEVGNFRIVHTASRVSSATPISYAAPLSTVVIADGNFTAAMVGMRLVFEGTSNGYVIAARDGTNPTTTVTVVGNAGAEAAQDYVYVMGMFTQAAEDEFTLLESGDDYPMPDDFGGMEGEMTFDADEGWTPIPQTGEGKIRDLRQLNTASGRPQLTALRPISAATSGEEGQRFELMVWPTPDAEYTLYYKYRAFPRKLDATRPFPLGGMMHSEALKASCLAVAELEVNDSKGEHWASFIERLATSVMQDREAMTPETLGYNADGAGRYVSDRSTTAYGRWTNTKVTVDGVEY